MEWFWCCLCVPFTSQVLIQSIDSQATKINWRTKACVIDWKAGDEVKGFILQTDVSIQLGNNFSSRVRSLLFNIVAESSIDSSSKPVNIRDRFTTIKTFPLLWWRFRISTRKRVVFSSGISVINSALVAASSRLSFIENAVFNRKWPYFYPPFSPILFQLQWGIKSMSNSIYSQFRFESNFLFNKGIMTDPDKVLRNANPVINLCEAPSFSDGQSNSINLSITVGNKRYSA